MISILNKERIDLSIAENIQKILPQRKTKIIELYSLNNLVHAKLFTDCESEGDVKLWLKEFEEKTKSRYSISTTKQTTGRYVHFKQFLKCQHNTRSKELYEQHNRTRNTNCPSNLRITLHAVKKRYQGKDKELGSILKELPCEIFLISTHNHNTDCAVSLKYREVSAEVTDKLINLFNSGHSPASALEIIKLDIYLNEEHCETLLADRKYCPDYMYCYHLYIKVFKREYGPLEFDEAGKTFLKNKLDDYNNKMKENCAQMVFYESEYIICLCPPLFKRVHEYIDIQMVLMDSTGTLDHDGSRVFVLLTPTECGGLPLGVFITSSEQSVVIKMGLNLLKDIVGNKIFRGHPEGPPIFLTDDSHAEQSAISSVFPSSKCLLCIFHVLQAIKRWLTKSKNSIPTPNQELFFQNFKSIMFAQNKTEVYDKYKIAVKNSINHPNYLKYLEGYWQRRHLWALPYRYNLLTKGHNTNNISEAVMRIMKDKILNRVKAFNVTQLTDFFLTKFVTYYEIRLLDSVHNRTRKKIFGKSIKPCPAAVLQKIQILDNCTAIVPSENKSQVVYIVRMDELSCTCLEGNTGKICKHIDWACSLNYSQKYYDLTNNDKRKLFYFIATENDSQVVAEVSILNSHEGVGEQIQLPPNESSDEKRSMLLAELTNKFKTCIDKSPSEIIPALEKMLENLNKIKTTSGIASAMATFGRDFQRRNRRSRIPVQPTAVSRRRKIVSGRTSNIGGRPRIKKEL